MSYSGVLIDGIDTLTTYGLALLADLTISTPEPRTTYVSVPEADGDLDLTGALTGGVVRYAMRQISFSLYPVRNIIAGTNEIPSEFYASKIREQLTAFIHGKERRLILPNDPEHYFIGRMAVGEKAGYNDLRIPVTMTAQPWRYNPNKRVSILGGFSGDFTIINEGPPTTPTFISYQDNAAIFTFNGGTTRHIVRIGENVFTDVVLQQGTNTLTFTGPVIYGFIIEYNEAVL